MTPLSPSPISRPVPSLKTKPLNPPDASRPKNSNISRSHPRLQWARVLSMQGGGERSQEAAAGGYAAASVVSGADAPVGWRWG